MTDHARIKDLAMAALNACIARDMDAARDHFANLMAAGYAYSCGVIWTDVFNGIVGEDVQVGEPAPVMFINAGTGERTADIDAVRPTVRWVTRLANARAANDETTYNALWDAVPAGSPSRAHLVELLLMTACAAQLRGIDEVDVDVIQPNLN